MKNTIKQFFFTSPIIAEHRTFHRRKNTLKVAFVPAPEVTGCSLKTCSGLRPQIPARNRFSRRDRHGGKTTCNSEFYSTKHTNSPYRNNGRMNSKLLISISLLRFSLVLIKALILPFAHIDDNAKVHFIVYLGCSVFLYAGAFRFLSLKSRIL